MIKDQIKEEALNVVLVKSYTDKPWRSLETYQMIEASLKEEWEVCPICPQNVRDLKSSLERQRQQHGDEVFVFNFAEYLDEEHKEGFLPALLEAWKFPHLGSTAEVVTLGLDKAGTKAVLDEKAVPTPRYFVADAGTESIEDIAAGIGYPLIVKPLKEGGHIGIEEDSIVHSLFELKRAVQRVLDDYSQPALIEMYITGVEMREFSVGIIDGEPLLTTPVEIDYAAMDVDTKILSFTTAQRDLERIKLVDDEMIHKEIIRLSKDTFSAVGARDYSRVDLRMDHTGCYVLEINIMPGLGLHSFLPEAAQQIHGLDYAQFIQELAQNSMTRQGYVA